MDSIREPLTPGRRVLMLAHHFPPAGGSGSNRALAFARYLPEYGWEPLVVTPGPAWASNRDDRLLSELPAALRVIRTRSLEARPGGGASDAPVGTHDRDGLPSARRWSDGSALYGIGRDLRSNVGHLKRFPDAHLGWLPFALAAARRLNYDVAYSSSGPFTSHLVGLLLKRLTRRPWVAELRDGWYRWNRAIFPDYPTWRGMVERRLEAMVLRTADRVVLVTDRMADAFRGQYADLPADHFGVVPNGFDRAQFLDLPPADTKPTACFDVLHSGALYYGRGLGAFLDAAQRLVDAEPAFAEAFRLTLLGTLDSSARAELRTHKLTARVRSLGQVDHALALAAMGSASLLLLVANTTPGAETTVPGKLFEYLAVGRPILAIAAHESSTADVLRQTGGGWLAAPGDPAAIVCALDHAFRDHQGTSARAADQRQVARFDRRLLTADLARIFDTAVSTSVAARRI